MRNKLYINNTLVTRVKEGTFRYVEQVCQEGLGVRYGNAISSYIEGEAFYDANGDAEISEGDVINYRQELNVTRNFAPMFPTLEIQKGYFTVKKCVKGDHTYHFIAYDGLEKLNASYEEQMFNHKQYYPDNIYSIIEMLETDALADLGVTIVKTEMDAYNLTDPMNQTMDYFYYDGITYNDILSYFSELSSQYVRCTGNNYIHFKRFSTSTEGTYWYNADRYIIAPTDQITYTGTAVVNGTPQTVNLIPIFYKEDGLKREDYSFQTTQDFIVKNIRGETWYSDSSSPHTVDNPYIVQKNPLVDKLHLTAQGETDLFGTGFSALTSLMTDYSICPFEVHLFPFRNPFNAGQILPHIVDKDGNRFSSVIMKMEQTDYEVILTCSGAEYYYTSSSDNYDTEEDANFLNVAVNDLYESKVNKSGDTMSGTLKLPTVAPRAIEMTPLDGATNGGYIDFHYANSSADYTSRIIESASGTIKVIGNLEISNPLAVAQGGTGSTAVTTTSTITDIASAGGNTTLTGATYAEWGKVASVQIIIKRSVNTGTNTDVTVATLVSGKRPAITSPAIVRYNGSNVFSYVASDGGIRINTATSIPANTELIIDAIFILA